MFKVYITAVLLASGLFCSAQRQVVDKVIGVVGKYPVLLSDLQSAMMEREGQGLAPNQCQTLELLIFQKLLMAQADRDSIVVADAEVDGELNKRMAYFINKFGSEAKLEAFYGKRTNVIKDELRSDVQDQLLAEKMQGKIAGEIKLTPAEVRNYLGTLPADSLPLVNSEVELQQLTRQPTVSQQAKAEAKELISGYRQRVIDESVKNPLIMSTMAKLYTEDPGSMSSGGLYMNVVRGQMDPAFEAVAFRLKDGEISNVFETAYGYHFIQLVKRRGELLDLRHLLIMPKMTNEDYFRCKMQLDSIHNAIKDGRITFEDAVKKYSDDTETKQNGGLMVNPRSASTRFDVEDLSNIDMDEKKSIVVTINSMQIGDLSHPMQYVGRDGKPGFRILKLKNRIDPHKANVKDDYQLLQNMASAEKRRILIKDWIRKRSKITYIKLEPEFACKFENEWTISN